MPIYVYKFVETGETIEVQQAFTDDALTEARHPGTGDVMAVKKVFTPVGVTFRGGGFYKTDSRGKPTKAGSTNGSSSDSSSSGSGSTSSGSGSDSGSSSGSGGDSKRDSKSPQTSTPSKSSSSSGSSSGSSSSD